VTYPKTTYSFRERVTYIIAVLLFLVRSYIHNELEVAVLGPKVDLTYDYEVRRDGRM